MFTIKPLHDLWDSKFDGFIHIPVKILPPPPPTHTHTRGGGGGGIRTVTLTVTCISKFG